jgi:probable O-glycosylation ligase (exosortase A-associated)
MAPRPAAATPVRPSAGAPPTAPAEGAAYWKSGAAEIKGTGILFAGYLLLIFVEFLGLPNQYPILKAIKFSTILSYGLLAVVVAKAGVSDAFNSRASKLLVAFLFLTWMSIFWAVVRTYALNSVRPLFDYLGLMVVGVYLMDRKSRMDWFAVTFSVVAIYLVGENWNKLGGGPRVGAFKAPYFMGDGNDFAWWLALTLPLSFSLVIGKRSKLLKLLGLIGSGACLLGVMGTQSRGAFLGIAGAFIYAWLFVSRKRAIGAVAIACVAVIMIIAAPSGYFARMNTVTDYEKDNSAQARIQAWKAGFAMACDYPLGVGAGNFSSANGRYYIPSDEDQKVGWGNRRWINAHSIYFKVLGEYGFPGLFMLLTVIFTLMQHNSQSRRAILAHPDGAPFTDYWPAFVNMSTIAFAMCGIFLGGFNYPHLFILTALALAVRRIIAIESGAGATRVLPGGALVPASAVAGASGAPAMAGLGAPLRRQF